MASSKVETPLHLAILHPDEKQRSMLSQALQSMSVSLVLEQSWSELSKHPLRLGGVWVLFDQGQETSQAVKYLRAAQEQAFWGILILGQGNVNSKQTLIKEGIDAYLSYPFDFNSLVNQMKAIAEKRTPISSYQVLPQQVAGGLDRVWSCIEQLHYYDLLELTPIATKEEIQARFHQRSLLLHPDRHRSLKKSHPPVYERVNMIYKRVLEAYKVLVDPLQRPLYDSAMALGSNRWDELLEERRKKILSTSEKEEIHLALAQALSMRSRGLLQPAYDLIVSIYQQEPQNVELKNTVFGYQKLIELATRNPDIATVLGQQVSI